MSSISHFLPIAPAGLCGGPMRGAPHFWLERKATFLPWSCFWPAFSRPRTAPGAPTISAIRGSLGNSSHKSWWVTSRTRKGASWRFFFESRGWRKPEKTSISRKGVWLYLQFELKQDWAVHVFSSDPLQKRVEHLWWVKAQPLNQLKPQTPILRNRMAGVPSKKTCSNLETWKT